ncbi:hypothetical protein D3C85_1400550 [compost metagenome]
MHVMHVVGRSQPYRGRGAQRHAFEVLVEAGGDGQVDLAGAQRVHQERAAVHADFEFHARSRAGDVRQQGGQDRVRHVQRGAQPEVPFQLPVLQGAKRLIVDGQHVAGVFDQTPSMR